MCYCVQYKTYELQRIYCAKKLFTELVHCCRICISPDNFSKFQIQMVRAYLLQW